MRVHPTILVTRSRRWQSGAIIGVLGILLLVKIVGRPTVQVISPQQESPKQELREVVVASTDFKANEEIGLRNVRLEKRPVAHLSDQTITDLGEITGKVAMGPIPRGYPITRSMVGEVQAALPAVIDGSNRISDTSPIDLLLSQLRSDGWVESRIIIPGSAFKAGDRIALAVNNFEGTPIIVIDEAWVVSTDARGVTVLVPIASQLYLESVKSKYQAMVGLSLPSEGDNIYRGAAISNLDELSLAMSGAKAVSSTSTKDSTFRSSRQLQFKGYAWLPDSGVRYAIDKDGTIFIVSRNGASVLSPLRDFNFPDIDLQTIDYSSAKGN